MFTKEFLFLFIKIFLELLLGYLIFLPIFNIVQKLTRLCLRDLKLLIKLHKYKKLVINHVVYHIELLGTLYSGLRTISILNSMDDEKKNENIRMKCLRYEVKEILEEIKIEVVEFKKLFRQNKITDLKSYNKIINHGDNLEYLVDTSVKRLLLKASDYIPGQIEVEYVKDKMNMTIHCKNTDKVSVVSTDSIINKECLLSDYFDQLEEVVKVASYGKCYLHIIID